MENKALDSILSRYMFKQQITKDEMHALNEYQTKTPAGEEATTGGQCSRLPVEDVQAGMQQLVRREVGLSSHGTFGRALSSSTDLSTIL